MLMPTTRRPLHLFLGIACALLSSACQAEDTPITKFYKSITPLEQKMTRAVMSTVELFQTAVDYRTLSPSVLEKIAGTDFGNLTDMRKEDLNGLAIAEPVGPTADRFIIGYAAPDCASLLPSLRASLENLQVAKPPQVQCKGDVVTVVFDQAAFKR